MVQDDQGQVNGLTSYGNVSMSGYSGSITKWALLPTPTGMPVPFDMAEDKDETEQLSRFEIRATPR